MGAVVKDRGQPTPHKVTPLPARQLAILCVVLLTESICSTILIPFVGYYVSYITGTPVDEAGYSVGYLVGFFMLGQVISSKAWGILSEKCGRKVGLVIGVFFCAVAMCLFGFSTHVYTCAIWRLVHGLSAGCSLIAKTMIADLTDRTNQAKGFALVSLTWGCGTLIGPAAGGALYDPVQQEWLSWMHLSKDGFLGHHPAFLPCFVASLYNLFAVFVCVFFLNETNKVARPLYLCLPRSIGRPLRPLLRLVQPKLPGWDMDALDKDEDGGRIGATAKEVTIIAEVADTSEPPPPNNSGAEPDAKKHHHSRGGSHKGGSGNALAEPPKKKRSSFGFKQSFQDPVIRCVLLMSMLISASDMIYGTVFPLWAIASRDKGGLGQQPATVSVLVLVQSVPAILANMAFSRVLAATGSEILFWNIAQAGYAALTIAVPFASVISSDQAAFWYTLVAGMLRKVTECWSFGMIMLVVAQTAPPGRVSIMYGIQQATACIVRCFVPFFCSPLFAASIDGSHHFPFNHWLLFLICGIPLTVSILISGGVVIPPAEDEAAASPENGDDDGNGAGGRRESIASEALRNYSFLGGNASFAVCSQHSFMGSEHASSTAPHLILDNSYASLAHSFATNFVPGVLQSTILPIMTDMESAKHDDEEDSADGGHYHKHGKHHHHHHRKHAHKHVHHSPPRQHGENEGADDDNPLRDAAAPDKTAEPPTQPREITEADQREPKQKENADQSTSSLQSSTSCSSSQSGSGSGCSSSSSSSSSYDSRDASSQQSDSDADRGAELVEEEELPVSQRRERTVATDAGDQEVATLPHRSHVGQPHDHHHHHHRHIHALVERHYETAAPTSRQVEVLEAEDERQVEQSSSEEEVLPSPQRPARS